MPRKPRRTQVTKHPEIALGVSIVLFTLIVELAYGFASPALGTSPREVPIGLSLFPSLSR